MLSDICIYLFLLPLIWEDAPNFVIPMSCVGYEHLEGFLIAGAIQWGSTSLNRSGAARGIVLGARAAGSKEAAFELLDVEVRLRTNDVTWWGPWVVKVVGGWAKKLLWRNALPNTNSSFALENRPSTPKGN